MNSCLLPLLLVSIPLVAFGQHNCGVRYSGFGKRMKREAPVVDNTGFISTTDSGFVYDSELKIEELRQQRLRKQYVGSSNGVICYPFRTGRYCFMASDNIDLSNMSNVKIQNPK